MEIVMRNIADLIPYERNQKKHDAKQIKNVANSLKRFGWKQPVVIDSKDVIVVGHCRVLAAKQLGMEQAPCVVADDLSEDEIRELRIVDNATNESPWDFDMLNTDLSELPFDGFEFDFDLPDFSSDDSENEREEAKFTESISVVIDCASDEEAEEIFNQLQSEGYQCRISTL